MTSRVCNDSGWGHTPPVGSMILVSLPSYLGRLDADFRVHSASMRSGRLLTTEKIGTF